jgi:hypothetical protein
MVAEAVVAVAASCPKWVVVKANVNIKKENKFFMLL